jgi:siroheme synthase
VRATMADLPEKVAASGITPPAVTVIGAVAGFDPKA